MGIFATKETITLFVDEEGKITQEPVSNNCFEVLKSLPYSLNVEYSKKMSDSIIYGKGNSIKLKPGAFEIDKWLLSKVVKKIIYEEDGDIKEEPNITQLIFASMDNQIVTNLVNYLKDMYALTPEKKEETEEELDELGE
ncbi:MAG: hypothetical protein ACTSVB_07405 [Candidatus Heimdallarchaeaceae archaeon]